MPDYTETLTLHDFIIGSGATLKSALLQMTRIRRGVLFVCDEDAHLVGVLSDGDVRRSLLDDGLMVSPVSKLMNTDPVTARNLAEAAQLLRRLAIVAVPVLDEAGRIESAAVENLDRVLTLTNEAMDAGAASGQIEAVAVIPARGGSKRIPKKNLALVAGRSLLEWTIRAARESRQLRHIVVSTDDADIAAEARRLGVDVPWLRPPQLSRDDSPTIETLRHAIHWALENCRPLPRFGVLLEPTAPMRRGQHIDDALELLESSGADCVMTVSEVPHLFHPEEMLVLDKGLLQPYLPYRTMDTRKLRGEQSTVYLANGLVYAFRIESLLKRNSMYGERTAPLITPWDEFVDIDTQSDLRLAEVRMARRSS